MHRRFIPLAVLSAVALTATACSGSGADDPQVASLTGDSASQQAGDGDQVDPDEAFLAYAECMRDHDVPMEDPGSGGGFVENQQSSDGGRAVVSVNGVEVDPDVLEAADEACGHLLDDAIGDRQLDPAEVAEMQDQMHAFGECMRDQGADWQDPVISADGGRMTMRSGAGDEAESGDAPGGTMTLMDDPETQDALDHCSEQMGDGPGGREFRFGTSGGDDA